MSQKRSVSSSNSPSKFQKIRDEFNEQKQERANQKILEYQKKKRRASMSNIPITNKSPTSSRFSSDSKSSKSQLLIRQDYEKGRGHHSDDEKEVIMTKMSPRELRQVQYELKDMAQVSPYKRPHYGLYVCAFVGVFMICSIHFMIQIGQTRISNRLHEAYMEPLSLNEVIITMNQKKTSQSRQSNNNHQRQSVLSMLETGRPYVMEDHQDGSTLCFQLWGDKSNIQVEHKNDIVVYFAGLGGSRMEHFHLDSDKKLLLTIDKPGQGFSMNKLTSSSSSSSSSSSRYIDVADKVLSLLTLLEVNRFDIVGWSAGGPFALALAHQSQHHTQPAQSYHHSQQRDVTPLPPIPNRVSLVAAAPQWAKSSFNVQLSCPQNFFFYYFLKLINRKVLSEIILKVIEFLSGFEVELDLLVTPKYDKVLKRTNRNYAESIRQGIISTLAFADDMYQERNIDWGFNLNKIVLPIRIFHSPQDHVVPYNAAFQIHSELPFSSIYKLPPYYLSDFEEGHFIMVTFWSMIVNDGDDGHHEASSYLLPIDTD